MLPRRRARVALLAALVCAPAQGTAAQEPTPHPPEVVPASAIPPEDPPPLGPQVVLRWSIGEGAESCIQGPTIEELVQARLGRLAFDGAPSDRVIRGRIRALADAPGFEVRVQVIDFEGRPLGTRVLRSEREECGAIDSALVLLVAMLIDPARALRPPVSDAVPPQPPAPPPSPPVVAPPSPLPTPDAAPADVHPEPGPEVRLGAGALTVIDVLPGVAVGASLLGGVRFDWLALELALEVFPEAVASDSEGRGVLRSLGGSVAVCPEWRPDPAIVLGVCLSLRAAALMADGEGFDADLGSFVRPLVWPALSLRMAVVIDEVWIRLSGGAGVALVRDTFYVELADGGRRQVHRAGPVPGHLNLEVGWDP